MRKKFNNWLIKLTKFVDQPWYIPVVAILAALDSFLIVFPIDFLLITRWILNSKRWFRSAIVVGLGSALGALCLAYFISFDLHFIFNWFGLSAEQTSSQWIRADQFIRQHGELGVSVVSASFIPMQIAVVIAASAKMSIHSIFLAVWLGRSIKYVVYGFLCAYFPNLIRKVQNGDRS